MRREDASTNFDKTHVPYILYTNCLLSWGPTTQEPLLSFSRTPGGICLDALDPRLLHHAWRYDPLIVYSCEVALTSSFFRSQCLWFFVLEGLGEQHSRCHYIHGQTFTVGKSTLFLGALGPSKTTDRTCGALRTSNPSSPRAFSWVVWTVSMPRCEQHYHRGY